MQMTEQGTPVTTGAIVTIRAIITTEVKTETIVTTEVKIEAIVETPLRTTLFSTTLTIINTMTLKGIFYNSKKLKNYNLMQNS